MGDFSELKDESDDISNVEAPQVCRNDGFFVKTDLCVEFGSVDRLRCLFDQVLSCFLKRVSVNKDVIRVLPPKFCDGVEADLFNLFWAVRKIGDFEFVSKNELWEFVAEECGLDITHVGSLKVIYVKYLKDLDQWLNDGGLKDKKLENGELGVLRKLDSLFHELGGCKYSLSSVGLKPVKKGKCVDLEKAKTEMGFSRIDAKDGKFSGFDDRRIELSCEIVVRDVGSSSIDEKDENFRGFDDKRIKNVVRDVGTSRIDEKDEKFRRFDDKRIENDVRDVGSSRIHEQDGKFRVFDDKRYELLHENVLRNVGSSRIKDYDENFSVEDNKRVVLSSTNVLNFHSDNSGHNDDVIVAKTIVGKVGSYPKMKEESLMFLKMLDWVACVARNPHDIAIGSIPSSSKWKKYKGNEVWKQILLTKKTLFAKRNVESGNKVYGSQCSRNMQKKRHMMHPSMYNDDKAPLHFSSKRMRCSQRVTSVKSCTCPGCTSRSSSRNKRQKPEPKKTPQFLEPIEIKDDTCEQPETSIITLRAEVPEWTGSVSESDPKWLGTRMWPPPEDPAGKLAGRDLPGIGKGRRNSCKCPLRGSADCVRRHVAKNRNRVKRALGPLFYKWRFHQMGEEASSVSWSKQEETEFKSLVVKARQELTHRSKSRHEIMSNFWRRASESIPAKNKDVLVSYYFNVFVLRRRSYQNRIMPENIDSDDDEQEVGYEKIEALSVKCSKKMQPVDLES